MAQTKTTQRGRSTRGQSLVELALILPFLLAFVGGPYTVGPGTGTNLETSVIGVQLLR